jgi:hypothetical protein
MVDRTAFCTYAPATELVSAQPFKVTGNFTITADNIPLLNNHFTCTVYLLLYVVQMFTKLVFNYKYFLPV